MTEPRGGVTIRKLPTGVPGLDEILGGGLPEFSFNIIAGAPARARRRWPTRSCSPTPPPSGRRLYFTVAGRAGDQDAALPAAVQLLRPGQAERPPSASST